MEDLLPAKFEKRTPESFNRDLEAANLGDKDGARGVSGPCVLNEIPFVHASTSGFFTPCKGIIFFTFFFTCYCLGYIDTE